jgi:hypothetical protein
MALMSGGTPDTNTNIPIKISRLAPSCGLLAQRQLSVVRHPAHHIALNTIMASKRVQHQSHCLTRGKFCIIRGTRIDIGLAILQMSIANGRSFSDFSVVTIGAGRVAKCWCETKVAFQRTAAADSLGHFAA